MAEQAISECDCTILPMDATAAFSDSEKLFLEEQILLKKIPRIMVVLTKLDLVAPEGRKSVIEIVQSKLLKMGVEIPLYISTEGLTEGYEDISGIRAIQKQLIRWLRESSHSILKKERAVSTLKEIVQDLCTIYRHQLEVFSEKEEERKVPKRQKSSALRCGAAVPTSFLPCVPMWIVVFDTSTALKRR